MEKVKSWVIAHPYWSAAIVGIVGIIVIWWWFSGSSGTATSSDNTGFYNAAAQAAMGNDALQAQQAGAQAQDYQVQQSAAAQEAQTAAQASTQSQEISAARDIQLATIGYETQANENAFQAALAQTAGQVTVATQTAQAAVSAATIAATAGITAADLASASAAYTTYLQSGGAGAQIGEGPQAFRQTNIGSDIATLTTLAAPQPVTH
jgi:hypothetical protein